MPKSYWHFGLLLGLLVTILSIGFTRETTWGNCASYNPSYTNIRRVDCESLEHGYPFKFIASQPKIDVSTLGPTKTSPLFLGGSSRLNLRPAAFAADTLVWSALFTLLIVAVKEGSGHRRVK